MGHGAIGGQISIEGWNIVGWGLAHTGIDSLRGHAEYGL